jgi:DNA modification methylase
MNSTFPAAKDLGSGSGRQSRNSGRPTSWRIIEGDCRDVLASLPAESVQCCVTSPPYFGLRDYGHEGQLGLEATPDEYVAALVETFRDVRRVLRSDGTLWLNLGDSYCAAASSARVSDRERAREGWDGPFKVPSLDRRQVSGQGVDRRVLPNLKQKDLIGIPWMVAFALRADGWYLRSDIIWHKPNPMPESVTDRPTKAHEYLFLFSKGPRYFYDADAIREPCAEATATDARIGTERVRDFSQASADFGSGTSASRRMAGNAFGDVARGANKRSVWIVTTQPYANAHFATFPPKLIEPCILAGSAPGDTILDPFAGAGTTGLVALRHQRSFVGIELNGDYVEMARRRIIDDAPLMNQPSEAELPPSSGVAVAGLERGTA